MRFGGVDDDDNCVVEGIRDVAVGCFNAKYLVTLSKVHLGGGLVSRDSTAG
jgi:hypothetical protein